MNARKRLIIGIICGVFAAAFVLLYAAQVRAEEQAEREEALARYGGEQVEVCVATRDIAAGEELDATSITTVAWLADLLPADCAREPEKLIGQTASSSILANEPISLCRLGGTGGDLGVPAGLCAVSIPSQDVRAVGGAIDSGSLVDVYASNDSKVTLLGEQILILETSNSTLEGAARSNKLTWVTLAIPPESVQELLSASQAGNLFITMPSPETSSDKTRPTNG